MHPYRFRTRRIGSELRGCGWARSPGGCTGLHHGDVLAGFAERMADPTGAGEAEAPP